MPKQPVEIILPQLAESLVSATIDRWLKEPGQEVDLYEPLCELITDKVSAELPSTVKGTLVKILVGAGETVDVGTPVCIIETEASGASEKTAAEPRPETAETSAAVPGAASGGAAPLLPAAFDPDAPMRHRFSPAVQKLAAEHSIDLSRVRGTGMGGRITRKDVLEAAENGTAGFAVAAAPTPSPDPAKEAPKAPMDPKVPVRTTGLHLSETPRTPAVELAGHELPGRGEYFIDVTPVRNSIALKMRQSVTEIPHGWMMIEVDVTNLVLLRNKLKEEFSRREGINLTYMPFLCKATVNAIKDYPIMNSVWATDKIIVKRDINLSLAVGTEDSVITPVIRNADQKNIAGLAHEIHDLAQRTREGQIKLADLQGGTFTVNNTGAFGSILSQPIINYPQAAIMTFESIVKKPVVINDMIGVRSMVNICLSLDHRILDGVISGRFLQRVKENLESFNLDTKLY
ncbi:dihydrolipoamide acetyltransferase family protein [Cohnella zeiphila]|uniref:Dihydrolipoamide acetyltransferase component of pyruvate dehydrogenase complex n=1 Tax=Cohnella zeiphila TaxID=2761120 RepID=A0A7X0SMH7_9BACL|nr:dihydrolipoamide acetyltransferase family protein [Cohnella zeiphila]MBB6730488.1 2-oxo acid dehydrogenase subunit E2 [Cohnella zeiphila]